MNEPLGTHYGKALSLGVLDQPTYRDRAQYMRDRGYSYENESDFWVQADTGKTIPDALLRDTPVPKYGAAW